MAETEEDPAGPAATEGADDTGTSDGGGSRSVIAASVRAALGSDSWLLRSYAVVGTLLALLVALLVVLAIPAWIASTVGGSPAVLFSRAFLIAGGTALIAALFAPAIFSRRRHRDGRATRRSDFVLGLTGYNLVVSIYVALLVSAPPDQRDPPPEAIAPVVEFFYALDPVYAVVAPVGALALLLLVGFRWPAPGEPPDRPEGSTE